METGKLEYLHLHLHINIRADFKGIVLLVLISVFAEIFLYGIFQVFFVIDEIWKWKFIIYICYGFRVSEGHRKF